MFKVFIYLYIFLESVLCKTWFWLFPLRGEAGAEILVVIQVAAGLSQDLEGSLSSDRDISSVMAVHIQCLWGNFTHRVWNTNGSEKVLCFLSTALVLATPSPATRIGRVPTFVFSPPHHHYQHHRLSLIPALMQRVLQGLEVVSGLPLKFFVQ